MLPPPNPGMAGGPQPNGGTPLSSRAALRYRYAEEGRMALIIKDIAIVAGLGLLYLTMVIVMIVIAIIARE